MSSNPGKPHLRLSEERAFALGIALKAARAEREMTQEALAEATGLTVEPLQVIERGRSNPTLATVYAMADALDMPITQLLSE